MVDISILEELTRKAIKAGASDADAIAIESLETNIDYRLGKLESIESAESSSIGLRVFIGKQNAIVSTSDLRGENLDELVTRAINSAKYVPEDPFSFIPEEFAKSSEIESLKTKLDLVDKKELDIDYMLEKARECEESALGVNGITNSQGAGFGYSKSAINLYTSKGFSGEYHKSSSSLSIAVLAGEGTKMERDYAYSSALFKSDLKPASEIGLEAANRTLKRLNPRKIKTCEAPVIFENRIARSLLSHFASAISGSSVARKTSFLQDMIGKKIFNSDIEIIDNPHIVRGLGSRPFDAEGLATKQNTLVSDGVLKSWILDTSSASQLGMKSTASASRGVGSPPSPSTSNLYMQASKTSLSDMIKDIKYGLFITETSGMGVNIVTGDYSLGAGGFLIENGEITFPVNEITIASNLVDMFANLTPANDIIFDSRTCCPSLLINKMTIAGS